MLVIGDKYTFTDLETKRLNKQFKNIQLIKDDKNIINKIDSMVSQNKYTLIVLNMDKKVSDKFITYLTNLQFNKNIRYISIEHFLEKYLQKCYIPKNNSDLHYLDDIKRWSKWQDIQKRAIDFFGIFWLFLFSFPIMLKCKTKIKEQSSGEVLFKQKRVGQNNKEFTCVKFRSMHKNTEFFNHYTQENDPRIFPWGKIMRQRRYDELPQIINILKGDMHIIGPRAEWNELVKTYEKQIPHYNLRHLIAPGITGWAQVMYPYGENIEDTRQKLMYDLWYIKNWSFWLDLKIVVKTAMVVISKKGI